MHTAVKKLVFLALAAAGLVILGGCASNPQDSSVPWSRPAEWEGKLPGVGGL